MNPIGLASECWRQSWQQGRTVLPIALAQRYWEYKNRISIAAACWRINEYLRLSASRSWKDLQPFTQVRPHRCQMRWNPVQNLLRCETCMYPIEIKAFVILSQAHSKKV
jgi:hypothetical protein